MVCGCSTVSRRVAEHSFVGGPRDTYMVAGNESRRSLVGGRKKAARGGEGGGDQWVSHKTW